MILSNDSEERKNTPIYSGVIKYFPLALAAVARHSKRGNDKHNPGQPLHWAREKSTDHEDCIARHLVDIDTYNAELDEYEDAVAIVWRGLAKLQLLEEKRLAAKAPAAPTAKSALLTIEEHFRYGHKMVCTGANPDGGIWASVGATYRYHEGRLEFRGTAEAHETWYPSGGDLKLALRVCEWKVA